MYLGRDIMNHGILLLCCAPRGTTGTYVRQMWGSPLTFSIFLIGNKEHAKKEYFWSVFGREQGHTTDTFFCFIMNFFMRRHQRKEVLGILYYYLPIPKLDNYWYHTHPTFLHGTPVRVVPYFCAAVQIGGALSRPRLSIRMNGVLSSSDLLLKVQQGTRSKMFCNFGEGITLQISFPSV